jgi:lysophospholipase L1-like esterase
VNLRPLILVFAIAAATCIPAGASDWLHEADKAETWSPAWYSPTFPPTANLTFNDVRVFDHQTVRQVVPLEAGGNRLRVRLSNALGLAPVMFGAIHVAASSPNGVTEPQTDQAVLFGGRPDGEIPVGGELLSDPVDLKVKAFETLAVSVYYPGRLAPSGHLLQLRLSKPGDHTADSVMPFTDIARAPSIVCGVEVEAAPRNVVVAFGDSITEGAGATPGMNLSWPQQLALRLAKNRLGKNWTVINAGISGNRLLYDGAGQRGLDRFDRDALNMPGLKAVILLEGINDIGAGSTIDSDTGPRSADDIIGAYKQLIARAHARGVKIYGGTLIPYSGAVYFTAQGEAVRQAVNDWIRSSGAFDGVVDFDRVMRDPSALAQFIGAFQSGDNLHPNDAGYAAMADAIDLKMLTDSKPVAAHR